MAKLPLHEGRLLDLDPTRHISDSSKCSELGPKKLLTWYCLAMQQMFYIIMHQLIFFFLPWMITVMCVFLLFAFVFPPFYTVCFGFHCLSSDRHVVRLVPHTFSFFFLVLYLNWCQYQTGSFTLKCALIVTCVCLTISSWYFTSATWYEKKTFSKWLFISWRNKNKSAHVRKAFFLWNAIFYRYLTNILFTNKKPAKNKTSWVVLRRQIWWNTTFFIGIIF